MLKYVNHSMLNNQHTWSTHMTIYCAIESSLCKLIRFPYELRKLWGKWLHARFWLSLIHFVFISYEKWVQKESVRIRPTYLMALIIMSSWQDENNSIYLPYQTCISCYRKRWYGEARTRTQKSLNLHLIQIPENPERRGLLMILMLLEWRKRRKPLAREYSGLETILKPQTTYRHSLP